MPTAYQRFVSPSDSDESSTSAQTSPPTQTTQSTLTNTTTNTITTIRVIPPNSQHQYKNQQIVTSTPKVEHKTTSGNNPNNESHFTALKNYKSSRNAATMISVTSRKPQPISSISHYHHRHRQHTISPLARVPIVMSSIQSSTPIRHYQLEGGAQQQPDIYGRSSNAGSSNRAPLDIKDPKVCCARRALFTTPDTNNNNNHSHKTTPATNSNISTLNRSNACRSSPAPDNFFKTDDPVLIKWLQTMRYQTELECLSSLQARSLAIDEHSAEALSVRNSQVAIHEIRQESNIILDFIDHLIDSLPLNVTSVAKFSVEFSELWTRLMNQTSTTNQEGKNNQTNLQTTFKTPNRSDGLRQQQLTIINCTPRKHLVSKSPHPTRSAATLRPLDKLAVGIRGECVEFANFLYEFQEATESGAIDNDYLDSSLRKLKQLYGQFVEIYIRAECANIVSALQATAGSSYLPSGNQSATNLQLLTRMSSNSSVQPVKQFESSNIQLPLKWALIALWQLTKDDSYLCKVLTEKWQTSLNPTSSSHGLTPMINSSPVKRLDYSTKYDEQQQPSSIAANENMAPPSVPSVGLVSSLRSDYEQLYRTTYECHKIGRTDIENKIPSKPAPSGALSSALKMQVEKPASSREVSTIELLIGVIISQPNKHERVDVMNFVTSQAMNSKLIDLDELDHSVSAAIYTGNQYKVAALRILNHLCINDQTVKTILKCFATPPPAAGKPLPQNKIIRSIFECYQTSQEHIYQNETMFNQPSRNMNNDRKRRRGQPQNIHQTGSLTHQQPLDSDDYDYSDYGSGMQTWSAGSGRLPSTSSYSSGQQQHQVDIEQEDGEDIVVREAIRLVVQLTDTFHRTNKGLDYYTLIGRFSIESLVKYLTNIVKSTRSREMLYLCLTALANISFVTTDPMKTYGTTGIILELFRTSKQRAKDLELRDQAVTIMANTADKNFLELISNGGLTFLLSCLESCPAKMANYKQLMDRLRRDPLSEASSNRLNIENKPRDRRPIDLGEEFSDDLELDCGCDSTNSCSPTMIYVNKIDLNTAANQRSSCITRLSHDQLRAMERIHQKTAVAFARLSVDPSTIRMILKYGGIKQMIDLCKFSHKRNHSDTVLIACIAALRKMAKVIESETFRYYNALDLIELDFKQTVEIYGSHYGTESHSKQNFIGNATMYASDV